MKVVVVEGVIVISAVVSPFGLHKKSPPGALGEPVSVIVSPAHIDVEFTETETLLVPVMLTCEVSAQPIEDVVMTLYVPGQRFVAVGVVCPIGVNVESNHS